MVKERLDRAAEDPQRDFGTMEATVIKAECTKLDMPEDLMTVVWIHLSSDIPLNLTHSKLIGLKKAMIIQYQFEATKDMLEIVIPTLQLSDVLQHLDRLLPGSAYYFDVKSAVNSVALREGIEAKRAEIDRNKEDIDKGWTFDHRVKCILTRYYKNPATERGFARMYEWSYFVWPWGNRSINPQLVATRINEKTKLHLLGLVCAFSIWPSAILLVNHRGQKNKLQEHLRNILDLEHLHLSTAIDHINKDYNPLSHLKLLYILYQGFSAPSRYMGPEILPRYNSADFFSLIAISV